MKITINKPTENSLGKPIHATEQGIVNFWKWFKNSKAVDAKGRPLVVYHGTHADIDQIDTTKYGKGLDQYGSGFYTTTLYKFADSYADKEYGNVLPLYIRITNPVPENRSLTRLQIYKLIVTSPNYEESLYNYGDWEYYGKTRVTNEAVDLIFKSKYNALEALNVISNDFWSGNEGQFVIQVNKVCKYDGVIQHFDEGIHFVTWMPDQVKSVFNKGTFGKTSVITA